MVCSFIASQRGVQYRCRSAGPHRLRCVMPARGMAATPPHPPRAAAHRRHVEGTLMKAMLGPATSMPSQVLLLDEVRSLRRRITELEARLAEAEAVAAEHDQDLTVDLSRSTSTAR